MKKLRVISIMLLCVILSMQTAWASGEYIYTSKGIYYKKTYDLCYNFTSVKIPIEAFPKQIAQSGDYGSFTGQAYTVYKNPHINDTLTIGEIYDFTYSLSNVVHNHIKYIQSIGGVMTGYAEQNNGYLGPWNEGYVISWDIGDKHHYAKFCGSNNPCGFGYYDLEFSNRSESEEYILQLNNTLGLVFGDA